MRRYETVEEQITESGCKAYEGQVFRYIERVTLGLLSMIVVGVMWRVSPEDPIGSLLLQISMFLLGAGFVMLCVMDLFAFVEAQFGAPASEASPRLVGCRVKDLPKAGIRRETGIPGTMDCRERELHRRRAGRGRRVS